MACVYSALSYSQSTSHYIQSFTHTFKHCLWQTKRFSQKHCQNLILFLQTYMVYHLISGMQLHFYIPHLISPNNMHQHLSALLFAYSLSLSSAGKYVGNLTFLARSYYSKLKVRINQPVGPKAEVLIRTVVHLSTTVFCSDNRHSNLFNKFRSMGCNTYTSWFFSNTFFFPEVKVKILYLLLYFLHACFILFFSLSLQGVQEIVYSGSTASNCKPYSLTARQKSPFSLPLRACLCFSIACDFFESCFFYFTEKFFLPLFIF